MFLIASSVDSRIRLRPIRLGVMPVLLIDFVRYYSQSRGLRRRSGEQLMIAARHFQSFAGRPLDTQDLTVGLVRQFLAREAERNERTTTNGKRRALLTLWRAAADDNFAPVCEPRRIPRLREPDRLPEAWTKHEVERVICSARQQPGIVGGIPAGTWWASLLVVSYWTGCRIGALLQVRCEDVDLAEGYFVARAGTMKANRDQLYWLSDQAAAAIAAVWCPHRPILFHWPHHRRHFFRRLRQIIDRAGVRAPKRRFSLSHKLRRTNATYCAVKGGLELARQQAGHTDAAITQKSYIDPRFLPSVSARDVLPELDLLDR